MVLHSKNIPTALINEMAQNLEMGLVNYYHPKKVELIALPNEDLESLDPDEFATAWIEDLDKIEAWGKDAIKIEQPTSKEAFEIMAEFVGQVSDVRLAAKLEYILENNKPFQNFKRLIDDSDYREEWFAFRTKKNMEYVCDEIDREMEGRLFKEGNGISGLVL